MEFADDTSIITVMRRLLHLAGFRKCRRRNWREKTLIIKLATKTCHFVFDYNSGISWSICILFVRMEA